jgi:hypothetical protein
LSVSADSISLTIESEGPLVDLLVWDEDDALVLYDNFVTLPEAGRFSLRTRGTPSRLAARSLAGRHEIVTQPSAPARR